ncbi:Mitochondrial carrier protein [Macleaya cordata]|uniref:Mitochondrial carrier protein n=1 Tax=Macleaya cordata TaxID=56857 RepID=A0A200QUA5_MACCD|nr:Mitochondrial carrier protein [Macleaya cordata]
MAAHSQSSRSNQTSIKYRWVPLKVSSFDLSDVGQEVDVSGSDPHKQDSKESEPKSSEIVSTAEFVSAVGGLWNCANRSLSVFQPKANGKHSEGVNLKENVLWYSDGERNNKATTSADRGYADVDLTSATCSSNLVNSNFELISVAQKISAFETFCGRDRHSFFWRYLQLENSYKHADSLKMNKLASVRIPFDLGKIYSWISESSVFGLKNLGTLSKKEFEKPGETCISGSKRAPLDSLAMKSIISDSSVTKCEDPLPCKTVELVENVSFNPLYSEYFLTPVMNLEVTGDVSRIPSSILFSDYHIDYLVLGDTASEEYQHIPDNECMPGSSKSQLKDLHLKDELTPELCSLTKDKPNHSLVKQRHAFAGALAGTFVSLCLHPVDTIKTVIQSRSMSQKPIFDVVGSIISERGVTGLYRGIASNIASSAPISAVYTFTYESVKAALLPLLPLEYHSFAHCTAGGCASIATSFIFTPSERIKQQMQISSQYQNCWTALVGILNKGGFSSLYAGWGAVLCRNIPHSVIKFYTYERLKKLFLSSAQSNAHPTTFQTLVCGGLAGSTAALFTTPFDVVKTRLQTEQIPGSLRRYDGVFHALTEIGKHEGLKGLYRGLTPRLIMYVTQGAIFFASYEFFKAAFCLESSCSVPGYGYWGTKVAIDFERHPGAAGRESEAHN